MVILSGKTCSGKTTILKELIKGDCYKKLITYTTRDMRPGEKQDIDYHFITEEEFLQKVSENFFVEYQYYETVDGRKYYGSSYQDVLAADNKTIAILTPDGIRDIKKNTDKEMFVIYINSNNQAIEKRLRKRGDSKKEADRRMDADYIDFRGFELEADKIVNNHPIHSLEEVAAKVKQFIEQWRANG